MAQVVADINLSAAEEAEELAADRLAASGVQVDVPSEAGVNDMAAAAHQRYGAVDILVDNAALMVEVMGATPTTVSLDGVGGLLYLTSSAGDRVAGRALNTEAGSRVRERSAAPSLSLRGNPCTR